MQVSKQEVIDMLERGDVTTAAVVAIRSGHNITLGMYGNQGDPLLAGLHEMQAHLRRAYNAELINLSNAVADKEAGGYFLKEALEESMTEAIRKVELERDQAVLERNKILKHIRKWAADGTIDEEGWGFINQIGSVQP